MASWSAILSTRKLGKWAITRQISFYRLTVRTTRRILQTSLIMPRKSKRDPGKSLSMKRARHLSTRKKNKTEIPKTTMAVKTTLHCLFQLRRTLTRGLQRATSENLMENRMKGLPRQARSKDRRGNGSPIPPRVGRRLEAPQATKLLPRREVLGRRSKLELKESQTFLGSDINDTKASTDSY